MTDEMFEHFFNIMIQLSPENLCCDGELTMRQVRARSRQLLHEWAALEREVGRKVTQSEILARYHASMMHPNARTTA